MITNLPSKSLYHGFGEDLLLVNYMPKSEITQFDINLYIQIGKILRITNLPSESLCHRFGDNLLLVNYMLKNEIAQIDIKLVCSDRKNTQDHKSAFRIARNR
jgi:hypothetical protein